MQKSFSDSYSAAGVDVTAGYESVVVILMAFSHLKSTAQTFRSANKNWHLKNKKKLDFFFHYSNACIFFCKSKIFGERLFFADCKRR